jgi:acetyltransferase
VAVVGASAGRTAKGNAAIRNLQAADYQGDLHVVHPTASVVEGITAVQAVTSLPPGVDVALVSVPARGVVDVLQDLAEVGCGAALVPAVGVLPKDLERMAVLSRETGMVIHGPNCMGVVNVADRIPLWFYEGMLTDLPAGRVAIVSQSGSASMFVARSTERVGFSRIVSTGTEACLTSTDYLSWLAEDPDTDTVVCVLEAIQDLDEFSQAVHQLRVAHKRLFVLRVGRTGAGAAASVAHTGALIGSDGAYRAYFASIDVPLLRDYDELAAVIQCSSVPDLPQVTGTRVGIVTISGGQAALAADLATDAGLQLPTLSDETASRLAVAQPGASPSNPFDAGVSLAAPDRGFRDAVAAVAMDEALDATLVILDAQATLNGAEVEFTMNMFRQLAEARSTLSKPLILASSSSTSIHPSYARAVGDRVPIVRGIPNALAAIRALGANQRPVPDIRPASTGPSGAAPTELLDQLDSGPQLVPTELGRALLTEYGIPIVESVIVDNVDEALREAAAIGYPVVLKVVSPDIAHRSDVGGVLLDVRNPSDLRMAFRELQNNVALKAPQARVHGIEIQRQVEQGIEAYVGFSADPVFGSVVTVGLGGTLVELHRDVATAPGLVGIDGALQMIEATKLGTILAGYRGVYPPTDRLPLAHALHSVARLASELGPHLAEGDLNPVLVQPATGEVTVVDWLLVTHLPPTEPSTLSVRTGMSSHHGAPSPGKGHS